MCRMLMMCMMMMMMCIIMMMCMMLMMCMMIMNVYDVDGWLYGYYGSFLISIFYLYSFSSLMIIMNPNHLYINHISIINLSSSVYYFQSSSIYLIIIPLSIIFISYMVVNTFRLLHLDLRVSTYILLMTPFNCRRHHDFFT